MKTADRTALIALNTVIYTTEGRPSDEREPEYGIGQQFYRFEDVDYVFEVPPGSLKGSSESSREFTRSHLEHANQVTPPQVFNWLFETRGQEKAVAFLKDVLRFDPEQEVLLLAACVFDISSRQRIPCQ